MLDQSFSQPPAAWWSPLPASLEDRPISHQLRPLGTSAATWSVCHAVRTTQRGRGRFRNVLTPLIPPGPAQSTVISCPRHGVNLTERRVELPLNSPWEWSRDTC